MYVSGLIVRYFTEVDVAVNNGFIVAFLAILLYKWNFFKSWAEKFRLKDICYFCWCFWLSVPFCSNFTELVVSTIVAKTILTINAGL